MWYIFATLFLHIYSYISGHLILSFILVLSLLVFSRFIVFSFLSLFYCWGKTKKGDINFASKTEKYIYIYFTTHMVVLIGFICDLFWGSDNVIHDNSGRHVAAQTTCTYTMKNSLDLRKNILKHTLDSYMYTGIKSLVLLRSFWIKVVGKSD